MPTYRVNLRLAEPFPGNAWIWIVGKAGRSQEVQLSPAPVVSGVYEVTAKAVGELVALGVRHSNESVYPGVTFHKDANFQWTAWGPFGAGDYPWVGDVGMENDRASSVRVPPGWQVSVWRDRDFQDSTQKYDRDTPQLSDNDSVSSFKVRRVPLLLLVQSAVITRDDGRTWRSTGTLRLEGQSNEGRLSVTPDEGQPSVEEEEARAAEEQRRAQAAAEEVRRTLQEAEEERKRKEQERQREKQRQERRRRIDDQRQRLEELREEQERQQELVEDFAEFYAPEDDFGGGGLFGFF